MLMRFKHVLPALACIFATGNSHALFDEYAVLSAEEVEKLFSDRTVESYNLNTWRTSFTYYHSNGRLSQERLWRTRHGKWSVTDDGKICLKFGKSLRCRQIVERNGKYYKVLKGKDGEQKLIVRYRHFAEGNALAEESNGLRANR